MENLWFMCTFTFHTANFSTLETIPGLLAVDQSHYECRSIRHVRRNDNCISKHVVENSIYTEISKVYLKFKLDIHALFHCSLWTEVCKSPTLDNLVMCTFSIQYCVQLSVEKKCLEVNLKANEKRNQLK